MDELANAGLTSHLKVLEFLAACSLMVETKNVFDVIQALDRMAMEKIGLPVESIFFT